MRPDPRARQYPTALDIRELWHRCDLLDVQPVVDYLSRLGRVLWIAHGNDIADTLNLRADLGLDLVPHDEHEWDGDQALLVVHFIDQLCWLGCVIHDVRPRPIVMPASSPPTASQLQHPF